MANEAGTRLLNLTLEWADARDREAYGSRAGERSEDMRSPEEIAAEYETVLRSMFGPQLR